MALPRSPRSIAAQALHAVDPATGALVPPLQPATTFARDGMFEPKAGFSYGREGSPTVRHAEEVLAALEGGGEARLFASGLAAVATIFETLEAGRHVVAPKIMYHGVRAWLERLAKTRGIRLTLFDQSRPQALRTALRPGETAILWLECPVNPTWDVIDIADAAALAHAAGATLAVDATAAPPCTLRALDLGADLVVHAATKYLNGHSDVLGGALVTRAKGPRLDEIDSVRKLMGSILAPFEAWLLLRGMRTLFVRFEAASRTALTLAKHFESHPKIARVLYPGLASHPDHEIARRQMTGGMGGMLSLLIKGDAAAARRVAASTRLFVQATSFGGTESLIEHRRTIEGPTSPVPDNLLRLSIGLEDAEELEADLERALALI